MKYLQVTPTPSPIETWLHTQLEARGVDKVYSRYILSLFHSNDIDQDFLDLEIPTKGLKRLNKTTRSRNSSSSRNVDTQKLIRASVIDCLNSVSEYKVGIESLVDELYDRLNKAPETVPSQTKCVSRHAQSPLDQAQMYYDAFPALNKRTSISSALLYCCTATSNPWNGKHKLSGHQPVVNAQQAVNPANNDTEGKQEEDVPSVTENIEEAKTMDKSLSVKRKLFVEVEEPKDSLTSLMEKVDGIKDIWSDSETQSQLSTSSCSSFIPCGTNLTTSIWSDMEPERNTKWSAGENDSGVCLQSPEEVPVLLQSMSVLNHCPERSVFKPYVRLALTPLAAPPLAPLAPISSASSEENLLTSTKTHFCPIDKAPHYKLEAVQYTNGTTFTITSQVDEIDYEVDEDGTLNYENSSYMEFKANGLNTECYNLHDSFKPKFKVIAEDIGVQVDNAASTGLPQGEMVAGSLQRNLNEHNYGAIGDDFYFPGEESIARDIMKSLDDDESFYVEEEPCTKRSGGPLLVDAWAVTQPCTERAGGPVLVDAWAVAWPNSSIWSNTSLASLADDGWPTPSHDYQELSTGLTDEKAAAASGIYSNYSIWAPPFPLDSNSNVILCSKAETPLPLGVNMGNLKISSDRKRRHSSSQYGGSYNSSLTSCIKSDVSFFQQSITL